MDLKAVQENLSNYSGVNLVTRCIFLNKKKNEHSLDILKIALKECLRCGYLDLYKYLLSQTISPLPGFEIPQDQETIISNKNKNVIEQKLSEIQNYKNMKKQISVRISYYELGKIYFDKGCLKEALDTFLQAKDYNPGDNTVTDIAFHIKKIQSITKTFDDKKTVNMKDNGYPSESNDELKSCYWQIKILDAINAIASKDFQYALKLFRENLKYFEEIEELKRYTCSRDIADYYVVLLLMNCGRNELSKSFKDEKERKLIVCSGDSFSVLEALLNLDYVAAIKTLNKIFSRIEYDMYISDSHKIICDSIIEKIIIQFLSPFKQIKISDVSSVINISAHSCEQILIKMIRLNQLPFLIDSINQNLVFNDNEKKDKKIKLYKKGLKTISNYLDSKILALLRFRLNEIVGETNKRKQVRQEDMEIEDFYEEEIGQMGFRNFQDFM